MLSKIPKLRPSQLTTALLAALVLGTGIGFGGSSPESATGARALGLGIMLAGTVGLLSVLLWSALGVRRVPHDALRDSGPAARPNDADKAER